MLQIKVPDRELFNDATNEFIYVKGASLNLEHSLISISKWEAKWHKPFLGKEGMNYEESIDYIKCMTLSTNVNPEVYTIITESNLDDVREYLENPMTATWFSEEENKSRNGEVVTSELIYYWMVALNIPFECEKWHLNRLLTLIKVCNIKNTPPKKRSKREIMARNRALNESRKAKMNSRG